MKHPECPGFHRFCVLPYWLCVLALALAPSLGQAKARAGGYWRVQLENDMGWSDRYYTNGVRGDCVHRADQAPGWVRTALEAAGVTVACDDMAGWYIGQLMLTPSRIDLPVPDPGDRPFAGWLFFGVQHLALAGDSLGWEHRDTRAASLGVTGPWSGAEYAQKGVHWVGRKISTFGFVPPQGWDAQLPTEPTLDVFLERKWKRRVGSDRISAELLPYVNASLGTVNVVGRAGCTLRYGLNLPDDFGFAPITVFVAKNDSTVVQPGAYAASIPSAPVRTSLTFRGWGAHVFASAEGKGVARSLFFDGTLFRSSPSVAKESFVHDFVWGITVTSRRVFITYSHVTRSREFKAQLSNQVFHSLGVTVVR